MALRTLTVLTGVLLGVWVHSCSPRRGSDGPGRAWARAVVPRRAKCERTTSTTSCLRWTPGSPRAVPPSGRLVAPGPGDGARAPPWALTARRPGRYSALALIVSEVALVAVGLATLRSGLAGEVAGAARGGLLLGLVDRAAGPGGVVGGGRRWGVGACCCCLPGVVDADRRLLLLRDRFLRQPALVGGDLRRDHGGRRAAPAGGCNLVPSLYGREGLSPLPGRFAPHSRCGAQAPQA